MKMRYLPAAIAVAVLGLTSVAAVPAKADIKRKVTMNFASGASFSGIVSFLNDFSAVTGVSGVLTGYQFGTYSYSGSGSDSINWVWANGSNFSTGVGNYSTFLMDGPGSGYTNTGIYTNFIQFAYNYSSAPVLSFTSGVSLGGTDNFVNYQDQLVSGSISGVPEPTNWALLIAGVGLAGTALRRRRNQNAVRCVFA